MIMSFIDLSNPNVLKNFVNCQIRENKGKFIHKKDVVVFEDVNGNQYVVPEEILNEMDVVKEDPTTGEEQVVIAAPDPEPEVTGTGEVVKKKKGKLKLS
jgi:hypothetical protein